MQEAQIGAHKLQSLTRTGALELHNRGDQGASVVISGVARPAVGYRENRVLDYARGIGQRFQMFKYDWWINDFFSFMPVLL